MGDKGLFGWDLICNQSKFIVHELIHIVEENILSRWDRVHKLSICRVVSIGWKVVVKVLINVHLTYFHIWLGQSLSGWKIRVSTWTLSHSAPVGNLFTWWLELINFYISFNQLPTSLMVCLPWCSLSRMFLLTQFGRECPSLSRCHTWWLGSS